MSSGSESDDDYVPGEPEQVSEEESADEEVDTQYEKELEHNSKKRKSQTPAKGKKKVKTNNATEENVCKSKVNCDSPPKFHPVEEKKREDDLWAKFLEGTDTKPKSTSKESNHVILPSEEKNQTIECSNTTLNKNIKEKEDSEEREKRIFEFAGETIVVENNVIKEKIKTADTPTTVSKLEGPSRRRGAGLTNVLGQLNKKNKLSTLEKSKLDWDTYKKEEGIEEEIVSHNKGKAGFLGRRDFLERTDVRQYEIERDLRLNRRSNR